MHILSAASVVLNATISTKIVGGLGSASPLSKSHSLGAYDAYFRAFGAQTDLHRACTVHQLKLAFYFVYSTLVRICSLCWQ